MSNKLLISSGEVLAALEETKSRMIVTDIPTTFNDFSETFKWPTLAALRKMAFESETNGLSSAFVKFKKRRLVLPGTLFDLLKKGGN